MPLYQAIVLAIVQGLTEFLPVSSTAHLWLVPFLLKWKDPGLTFDVALHAGTLLAVLAYFWRYWVEIILLGFGLSGGSAPQGAGAASHSAREDLRQNPRLALVYGGGYDPGGTGRLAVRARRGGAVTVADGRRRGPHCSWAAHGCGRLVGKRERDLGHVGFLDSFLVGVAQAFAVIPGVSRSGVTMTAGAFFQKMKRETAARFSFLLSTPLIAGAAMKKGMEIRHEGLPPEMRLPFLCGILVSGLVGYLVIAVLIRYLERRTFTAFVIYRLALA